MCCISLILIVKWTVFILWQLDLLYSAILMMFSWLAWDFGFGSTQSKDTVILIAPCLETHSTVLHITPSVQKKRGREKTQREETLNSSEHWDSQEWKSGSREDQPLRQTNGQDGNMGFNVDYKGNPHSKLNSIYIIIQDRSSRKLYNLNKDFKLNYDSDTELLCPNHWFIMIKDTL